MKKLMILFIMTAGLLYSVAPVAGDFECVNGEAGIDGKSPALWLLFAKNSLTRPNRVQLLSSDLTLLDEFDWGDNEQPFWNMFDATCLGFDPKECSFWLFNARARQLYTLNGVTGMVKNYDCVPPLDYEDWWIDEEGVDGMNLVYDWINDVLWVYRHTGEFTPPVVEKYVREGSMLRRVIRINAEGENGFDDPLAAAGWRRGTRRRSDHVR